MEGPLRIELPDNTKKIYNCKSCQKSYSTFRAYNYHSQRGQCCDNENMYFCIRCEKRLGSLFRSVKIHLEKEHKNLQFTKAKDIIRRKFMPKSAKSRPLQTKELQIKLGKLKLCCHSGIKRKFNAYSRNACPELPQFCNECSPIAGHSDKENKSPVLALKTPHFPTVLGFSALNNTSDENKNQFISSNTSPPTSNMRLYSKAPLDNFFHCKVENDSHKLEHDIKIEPN